MRIIIDVDDTGWPTWRHAEEEGINPMFSRLSGQVRMTCETLHTRYKAIQTDIDNKRLAPRHARWEQDAEETARLLLESDPKLYAEKIEQIRQGG